MSSTHYRRIQSVTFDQDPLAAASAKPAWTAIADSGALLGRIRWRSHFCLYMFQAEPTALLDAVILRIITNFCDGLTTYKFAGGTCIDRKGYLVVKAGPHRDVRVATLVLEAKLGRKLRKDEDAHHINGDKLDTGDCGSNLEALGHAAHGAVSNKQRMFLKLREEKERQAWEEEFPGSTEVSV